jgi:hypothetical protein
MLREILVASILVSINVSSHATGMVGRYSAGDTILHFNGRPVVGIKYCVPKLQKEQCSVASGR